VRITQYRVVETSTVTDESLARILNTETRKGWIYDGMTFVPNEASKRPRMAFLIFTRDVDASEVVELAVPEPAKASEEKGAAGGDGGAAGGGAGPRTNGASDDVPEA